MSKSIHTTNPCKKDEIDNKEFTENENTYTISGHGILLNYEKSQKNFKIFEIPKNINIYTYVEIG